MKKSISIVTVLLTLLTLFIPKMSYAAGDVDNDVNFSRDVIYQIMTDRFYDGDSGNNPSGDRFDGSCSNLKKYCGGDWAGIIAQIENGYLTEMGITAIWISSPVENIDAVLNDAAGSTSYHGYWPRDFKRTNPYFGSFADFDALIQTAHDHGIKVVMDFVPNHTSPASEEDPSYAENGSLYDDGSFVASYSDDPGGYFHHNGGTDFSTLEDGIYRNLFDLADFNHQHPDVDQYLKEAVKGWLDRGIDGIRVDAVKHMPRGWQKSMMDEIYDHRPVFTFGEWFLGTNEIDANNHDFANESGMSLLDFRFGQTIREVLRDGADDWYGFQEMIEGTSADYAEVIDQVTFIDNHDMDRFTVSGGNTRNTDLALTVLLTSRGVPTIYYGTEQYLTGNGDPNNRKMMPAFDRTTRAYRIVQALAPLRQTNDALAYGDTQERWINEDVYIYERQFASDTALIAVNRSESESYRITGLQTALPQGTYGDELNGLLDGNSITVNGDGSVDPFDLGPGEAAVWQNVQTTDAPTIGHVGPMMGQAGHTVTIDGKGFGSSPGTVSFGTTDAGVIAWSNTHIRATVPDLAAGKYDITVTDANGNTSDAYADFEMLTGDQVSVRFIVNQADTNYGENVYLVGNVHELGNWNPDNAVGPMFNQVLHSYPTWYFDVNVPAGRTLEFKFVKIDSAGNVVWESGANHTYVTPDSGTGQVMVNWQN